MGSRGSWAWGRSWFRCGAALAREVIEHGTRVLSLTLPALSLSAIYSNILVKFSTTVQLGRPCTRRVQAARPRARTLQLTVRAL